jgi:hypothetical protein
MFLVASPKIGKFAPHVSASRQVYFLPSSAFAQPDNPILLIRNTYNTCIFFIFFLLTLMSGNTSCRFVNINVAGMLKDFTCQTIRINADFD